MSKVLITGGAGFIGSHVGDVLRGAGHEFAVVDNLITGFRHNVPDGVPFYEVDIRSADLAKVFEAERPDYVAHLAAQMDVRRSLDDPRFDADCNILGTINVLDCAVRYGVGKLIYASTGGAIYGEPEELPAPETYAPLPISAYGVSKYAAEHYIRLYNVIHGVRYTNLRFPNVYGPRQNPHGEAGVCAILSLLMLAGKAPVLYGYGEPTRDYVYVGDIARGVLLALDRGDNETLNLGSARKTSVLEIFEVLKELSGFDGKPDLQPLRPGEVRDICITGDRAAAVLGWKPQVDLREGLRMTLEHIREHGAG